MLGLLVLALRRDTRVAQIRHIICRQRPAGCFPGRAYFLFARTGYSHCGDFPNVALGAGFSSSKYTSSDSTRHRAMLSSSRIARPVPAPSLGTEMRSPFYGLAECKEAAKLAFAELWALHVTCLTYSGVNAIYKSSDMHRHGAKPMFRQVLSELADEAAFLITAFFARNAIVLVALSTIALIALARP